MANRYVTFNGTATTTEQTTDVKVDKIKFIANDDSTNDLYLAFDGSTATANEKIVVKPGESFANFDDISCFTLAYESSASTVAFRVIGTQEN